VTKKTLGQFQVYDADEIIDPSRPSKILYVTLCAFPMSAALLFGGVDIVVLGLFSVIAAFIFVLWVMDAWSIGELRFSTNPLQLPIIGLILIGIVQLLPLGDPAVADGALRIEPSNTLSLDPFSTRLFVLRLIAYLIFFAAALTFIDTRSRAKKAAIAIIIFGALLAFFGILQRLADPQAIYGMRPTPQSIAFGPFMNQHHFAAFMEMTSGLVLGMLLGSGIKRDRRPFLMIAAVLMGIALIFTGSRGGIISYACVIAFAVTATYFFRGRRNAKESAQSEGRGPFTLVAGAVGLALIGIFVVIYLGGGDSVVRWVMPTFPPAVSIIGE
jgi:hypothetical protein